MSWLTDEWDRAWGVVADFVRLSALAAGLWALVSQQPAESVLRFGLVLVVLLGVRAFALPRPFDAAFGATLVVAALASGLHWYQRYPWLDFPVHFVTTGAAAAVLYLMLAQLRVIPDLHDGALRRPRWSVVLLTAALGTTAGVLWEFYEWTAERYLPSVRLLVGYDDTIGDLAMDVLGGLVGGVLLAVWSGRGLGLQRRGAESASVASRQG